jgi:hypothetical protein
MGLFNFGRQPKKPEATDSKMEQQKKIGVQLKTIIDQALQENNVFNRMGEGKISDKVSRPTSSMSENGDSITIYIQHPEDKNLNGNGIALQIDINFSNKGKELHLHDGTFGGDTYRSIEEAAEFQRILKAKALGLSKFPQEN